MEEVLFPPEVLHSRTDSILLLLVTVFMPGKTFLIEGYNYLWALMIGLLGKHEISLLRIFPARKHKNVFKINSGVCASLHKYSILYSYMHVASVLEIFKDG